MMESGTTISITPPTSSPLASPMATTPTTNNPATNKLALALAEGFIYQGEPSGYRDGALRGEPSAALPTTAFIDFLQNHDQVGNRAFGERMSRLAIASSRRRA